VTGQSISSQNEEAQPNPRLKAGSSPDLPEDPDWSTLTRLELKANGHVVLGRQEIGVAVTIGVGEGETVEKQTVLIRWKAAE